jgi:NADH:ubiquinone oxidoreductase subunit 6 (subunit J)
MFLFLYTCAIVSGILMVISVNPINAVLFLISSFISVAMIFLVWNIEFFALIFIIIYVGAIAVLFLFIVMMINIKKIEKDNTTYLTIGSILFIIFFFQILIVICNIAYENNNIINYSNFYQYYFINNLDEVSRINILRDIGIILFYIRPILLILAGLILLIAMIASIYLTNQKRGFSMKKQFNQLSRQHQIVNVIINEST